MSLFHIANDGNTLTMMSVSSGYTIERDLDNIPAEVQDSLKSLFMTKDLSKPSWTQTGIMLAHNHALYLWFLFEKSEELRNQVSDVEVTGGAMSYYVDHIPSTIRADIDEDELEASSEELYSEDQ